MPLWPEPLLEGSHYLNLDLSPGQENKSGSITNKIDSWLQSALLIPSIRRNNADYFDRYLMPEMLGRSICQTVEDRSSGRPNS
jgi:hypothetical protein